MPRTHTPLVDGLSQSDLDLTLCEILNQSVEGLTAEHKLDLLLESYIELSETHWCTLVAYENKIDPRFLVRFSEELMNLLQTEKQNPNSKYLANGPSENEILELVSRFQ